MSTETYSRTYDVGDDYESTVEWEDVNGDLADPASVTFRWFGPDLEVHESTYGGGEMDGVTVLRDDVGQYRAIAGLDTYGLWAFLWVGFGGSVSGIRGADYALITVLPGPFDEPPVVIPVTVDELETFMQRRLDQTTAREILRDICGEAEAELHRGIGVVQRSSSVAIGPGMQMVAVDYGPVVSVEEVIVDGETLTTDDYYVVRDGIVLALSQIPAFTLTTSGMRAVSVTYTGGLSDPARVAALKSIIKARAARRWHRAKDRLHGVTNLGVEGYSVSLEPDGWNEAELKVLAANKRPVQAVAGGTFGGPVPVAPYWFNDIPVGGSDIWGRW